MSAPTFGVQHRYTGHFFAGFGPAPDFPVLWGDEQHAKRWATADEAQAQAHLLAVVDSGLPEVQRQEAAP